MDAKIKAMDKIRNQALLIRQLNFWKAVLDEPSLKANTYSLARKRIELLEAAIQSGRDLLKCQAK